MADGNSEVLGRSHQSRDFGIQLLGQTYGRFRYAGVEEVSRQPSEAVRAGAENFDILA